VCPGCRKIYSGRGVWADAGTTVITVAPANSAKDLAEKFEDIDKKVRRVEIDRVAKASLYDLLQHELEIKNPHDGWNKLSKQFPEVLAFGENLFIFQGQGQKPTPVVNLKEWLHILMLTKKPLGTEVRQVASEVLETKLNEVMGVVKSQGGEFRELFAAMTEALRAQGERLESLETKLESPIHNSLELTKKDALGVIRGLFESQWKNEFDKKNLVNNHEDWERFNSEWKSVNNGAKRENWTLKHYMAAVTHIRSKYKIDLWPSVIGPFVRLDVSESDVPNPTVLKPRLRKNVNRKLSIGANNG